MSAENAPSRSDSPSSFEQALDRLETIVQRLEDGQLGLAEALKEYEEGVKLLKECYALLQRAERRIELVSGVDAEGNPVTEPLDIESTLSREEKASSEGQARPRQSRRDSKTASRGRKPSSKGSGADVDEPGGLF